MIILFWACAIIIFYAYLGYPLWLAILKKVCPLPVAKGDYKPTISVVIAAHNEERNMLRRVQDIQNKVYPQDKLEVIVVSDGSTYQTIKPLRKQKFLNLNIIDLQL